jgi:hypothetical protein
VGAAGPPGLGTGHAGSIPGPKQEVAGDKLMSQRRKEHSRMKTPSRETAARSAEVLAAEVAKTSRLRALRLAKEAADRDAKQGIGAASASTR